MFPSSMPKPSSMPSRDRARKTPLFVTKKYQIEYYTPNIIGTKGWEPLKEWGDPTIFQFDTLEQAIEAIKRRVVQVNTDPEDYRVVAL